MFNWGAEIAGPIRSHLLELRARIDPQGEKTDVNTCRLLHPAVAAEAGEAADNEDGNGDEAEAEDGVAPLQAALAHLAQVKTLLARADAKVCTWLRLL